MSHQEIKSRYHILHLEVSHGADRYDIHLHLERPPLVRDLMHELEKKSRVTVANQQLIFRGQRLHQTPDEELNKFGLFNGNHIMLIGKRLTGQEDNAFRRLLAIEKDVQLIDEVLGLICRDFENIKRSNPPRSQCEHYLYDLHGRVERCQADLKTFEGHINEINVGTSQIDVQRKKSEIANLVQDRLNISSNIATSIASYEGSRNPDYYYQH